MAIRPSDLQSAILQAVQTAPITARAEEAPRQAALAAQATFIAQQKEREESIQATSEVQGSRVDANPDRQGEPHERRQRRKSGEPFDDAVGDASGLDEPAHLIDFSA